MAEELTVISRQVPAQIEELVQFVKFNREKLTAVRASIRAIEKLGLEDEKRQQALAEAQELSEQLLDAEVRLGEIMATLPESPGARTDLATPEDSDVPRTKKEILKEAGFSVKTAQRYEMLASHPELVAQAKAQARDKGVIVSRTSVLRAIQTADNPPYDVDKLMLSDEELERVQGAMGEFTYIPSTEESLEEVWSGNILLFPPKSKIWDYIMHLKDCFDTVDEAIVIVPQEMHEVWYEWLMFMANAVFYRTDYTMKVAGENRIIRPQDDYVCVYIGKNTNYFFESYKLYGWGHTLNKVVTFPPLPRLKK